MGQEYSFMNKVQQFPGKGGWVYVPVPKKYTLELKRYRRAWGQFPITARVGNTEWNTKLMMRKGGSYFIALNASLRRRENISVGKRIKVSFDLS